MTHDLDTDILIWWFLSCRMIQFSTTTHLLLKTTVLNQLFHTWILHHILLSPNLPQGLLVMEAHQANLQGLLVQVPLDAQDLPDTLEALAPWDHLGLLECLPHLANLFPSARAS